MGYDLIHHFVRRKVDVLGKRVSRGNFSGVLRAGFGLVAATLWALASAQSLAPEVSIVVRKHPTGADMVEITPVRADYPPDLLRRQSEQVGINCGSPVRGLELTLRDLGGGKANLKFLKATFATNNLINRETGIFGLEPIVRAFAGAPEPYTIEVLDIHFAGETPVAKQVKKLKNDSVAVVGNQQVMKDHRGAPTGVEYRVMLLTQDPAKITIPAHAPEKPNGEPEKQTSDRSSNVMVIALISLASVSAGALVYCLMLGARRPRPKAPS